MHKLGSKLRVARKAGYTAGGISVEEWYVMTVDEQ